ncbi:hypothetical protein CcrBL47_gp478 [Caulobacter phage BL47]|nr:hypothetical protein CcrBL47_gp478 [Caulobacter phage BL47]UTU10316.1 hypothetical protein CcrRB23_gp454 [Caulobacter phage RB23]
MPLVLTDEELRCASSWFGACQDLGVSFESPDAELVIKLYEHLGIHVPFSVRAMVRPPEPFVVYFEDCDASVEEVYSQTDTLDLIIALGEIARFNRVVSLGPYAYRLECDIVALEEVLNHHPDWSLTTPDAYKAMTG